jgi:hypothetical protein
MHSRRLWWVKGAMEREKDGLPRSGGATYKTSENT